MSRGGVEPELRRTMWRIGLQTALLLMFCLAAVGVVLFAVVLRSQSEQQGHVLDGAVQTVERTWRDADDHPALTTTTTGALTAVMSRDHVTASPGGPTAIPDVLVMRAVRDSGVRDRRVVHLADADYALLTEKRGELVIQAALGLHEQMEERQRLLTALLWTIGVGALLATLIGGWLGGRAVRPMNEALALQRRFVADASHELRTPLTLLSTRAQLLRRRVAARPEVGASSTGDRDVAIARDADGIVADTKALTEVLEELLLAADTRDVLPQTPVDVGRLVSEAVAAAQAEAAKRQISLTMTGEREALLKAGAPAALKRAVTELIVNSLTHARHEVVVSVGRQRRAVTVSVLDDGPGIPAEVVPRMFERFATERTPGTPQGQRRHYGLGLALVREVATRHGGGVSAQNRTAPYSGAELLLTLPAANNERRSPLLRSSPAVETASTLQE